MAVTTVDVSDAVGTNIAAVKNAALTGQEYALAVRNIETAPNSSAVANQKLVTTSSVQLTLGSPALDRRRVKIKNGGSVPIFIGFQNPATVTDGYQLDAGESDNFDVGPALNVYAIGATASITCTVYVVEFG